MPTMDFYYCVGLFLYSLGVAGLVYGVIKFFEVVRSSKSRRRTQSLPLAIRCAFDAVSRMECVSLGHVEESLPPVAEGEEVIGTIVDPMLRRLFSLHIEICENAELLERVIDMRLRELAQSNEAEIAFDVEAEKLNVFAREVLLGRREAHLFSECFWFSVQDLFPQLANPKIIGTGMREKWQVVTFPLPAMPAPMLFISSPPPPPPHHPNLGANPSLN